MSDSPLSIPQAYGIWIPGMGWLKKGSRAFADVREPVARAAAKLYGEGAFVLPIDAPDTAMLDFEDVFLERERLKSEHSARARVRRMWRGLLGYLGQRKS
jgi:hypothetical protein